MGAPREIQLNSDERLDGGDVGRVAPANCANERRLECL
jgi:hypothetical protein